MNKRIKNKRVKLAILATVTAFAVVGTAIPAFADHPATVGNTDGDGLNIRSAPNTSSSVVGKAETGDSVTITCQAYGESVTNTKGFTSNIWDYSEALGGYLADAYMATGYDAWIPGMPECEDSGEAYPEGFDNSNNNEGTIDFDAAGQQFDFAILKASESTDFVDAYFKQRFQAAKGKIILGAYHFFDPRADGVAQAEHNLAVLADAGYDVADDDTLPIMVDVEPNYVEPVGFCFDTSASVMNSRLNAYIDHITQTTGQAPLIYTNGEMIRDCGLDTAPLLDLDLVVPAWKEWDSPGDDPQATARALGWDTWTFWQWSARITIPGGVDALADRFNGTKAQLTALAAG